MAIRASIDWTIPVMFEVVPRVGDIITFHGRDRVVAAIRWNIEASEEEDPVIPPRAKLVIETVEKNASTNDS